MNKNYLIIVIILLISIGITYGYNGDICNETHSPCGGGCTSTDLSVMYQFATNFDTTYGNISGWDTSCITNMNNMFYGSDFNQNINSWNTSNVTGMQQVFQNTPFNQPLNNWDVSKVTLFNYMFRESPFNQPLNNWDTRSADTFTGMFSNNTFNQNIGMWNISLLTDASFMFEDNMVFSTTNYDLLLNGWGTQTVQTDTWLDAPNTTYQYGITGRDTLINTYEWVITDAGGIPVPTPEFKTIYCYQESANISNQVGTDGDCGLNYTGIYKIITNDSNKNYLYINYSIPKNIVSNNLWQIKFNTFLINLSLNNCSFQNNLQLLFFRGNPEGRYFYCHNGTNWINLYSPPANTSSGTGGNTDSWIDGDWNTGTIFESSNYATSGNVFYEEGIFWNVSKTFYSTWNTSKTSTNSSLSNQIKLPLESTGTYNFNVDWGDGESNSITVWNQTEVTHTYNSSGIYNISISGIINGFRFNNGGDKLKIININRWGDLQVGNNNGYFYGCSNLNSTAKDNLNLIGTTNLDLMFREASKFNGNISGWDVSNVTSMAYTFRSASLFNQPLNNWNTGKVTNMQSLFGYASKFNGNISNWNTSSVTNMANMFYLDTSFNTPIGSWDTHKVNTMGGMFALCDNFNQSLGNWNTSNVTNMANMFYYALIFDNNISNWDTSKVTTMSSMFEGAGVFNSDISKWNTANVKAMDGMFSYSIFDNNISDWNTGNVTTMAQMFLLNTIFNKPINKWNVGNVVYMSNMFAVDYSFDQNITDWNVSKVVAMDGMFAGAPFNQNISRWDVSNVESMQSMFIGTSFDQNIGMWNITKVKRFAQFLEISNLSTSNYDALLLGWSNQTVQNNMIFDGGYSTYTSTNGIIGRDKLINTYNWTITDGGMIGSTTCLYYKLLYNGTSSNYTWINATNIHKTYCWYVKVFDSITNITSSYNVFNYSFMNWSTKYSPNVTSFTIRPTGSSGTYYTTGQTDAFGTFNLTNNENSDIDIYVNLSKVLPKNIDLQFYGSGIPNHNASIESLYCYQESANTTNQTGIDGNCGLSYSGKYGFRNTSDTGIIYINYTKPTYAYNNSLWQVKASSTGAFGAQVPTLANYSIPSTCWIQSKIQFSIYSISNTSNNAIGNCYNGTTWIQIFNLTNPTGASDGTTPNSIGYLKSFDGLWTTSAAFYNGWGIGSTSIGAGSGQYIYEEAMIWKVSQPFNVSMKPIYDACYQESANTTNQTGIDGNCGLNYSGKYTTSLTSASALYDGDWATTLSSEQNNNLYVNYSVPNNVVNVTAQFKYSSLNCDLLNKYVSCYNGTGYQNLHQIIDSESTVIMNQTISQNCIINNTVTMGYPYLKTAFGDSCRLYEDAMIWNVSTTKITQIGYFSNSTYNGSTEEKYLTTILPNTSMYVFARAIYNNSGLGATYSVNWKAVK